MYSAQCTVHSVQCTLYTVLSPGCSSLRGGLHPLLSPGIVRLFNRKYVFKTIKKSHWISRPMQIVGPIQFWEVTWFVPFFLIFFLSFFLRDFLQSPRNWGLCLDITILVCLLACLFVRPLRSGCVILLLMKLRRMEWWNAGMMEWSTVAI